MKQNEIEQRLGITLSDYQQEYLEAAKGETARTCLYYKTGAGKSITSMAALAVQGYKEAVVVAPPITHSDWVELGNKLGIKVHPMSHAKFRMKDTLLSRNVPVIADEFHLFGGHRGKGWIKLERLARGLKAPMILCSATPNYNDIERCYCVQKVLNPGLAKGYIDFIYQHCNTEQNNFGVEPIVTSFRQYRDAAQFLSSQPGVYYVEDDAVYDIVDIEMPTFVPEELELYGLNRRKKKICASIIEKTWARTYHNLLDDQGKLRSEVYWKLVELAGESTTPILVFCHSSAVAEAVERAIFSMNPHGVGLITGKTSEAQKEKVFRRFLSRGMDALVGTASMATGADGLDKVCDTMIIVHDTPDDSQRRQLVGRILNRGINAAPNTGKQFYRLTFPEP